MPHEASAGVLEDAVRSSDLLCVVAVFSRDSCKVLHTLEGLLAYTLCSKLCIAMELEKERTTTTKVVGHLVVTKAKH